ncbi:Protein of unknown function [Pyronema omphalodes CBS 100304]|uniref:Uncharacterized protein n=1 Tax=Pyronema omphalodes (strain CBS 100304) TaxID=1076935 RepID=U4L2Z6_PYROM|nr:Protein of unknown function [Pyronema omphalodes CBS 100304]
MLVRSYPDGTGNSATRARADGVASLRNQGAGTRSKEEAHGAGYRQGGPPRGPVDAKIRKPQACRDGRDRSETNTAQH